MLLTPSVMTVSRGIGAIIFSLMSRLLRHCERSEAIHRAA
jgi:hypothetical protein